MDAIYYWTGFMAFWLLAIAGLGGTIAWCAVTVHGYVTGQVRFSRKHGLFFFGWQVLTKAGKSRYLAQVQRDSELDEYFPNSSQKMTRDWLYTLLKGRYAYAFCGLEIFWAYRFTPCWPWQIKGRRKNFRTNPVTWYEAAPGVETLKRLLADR